MTTTAREETYATVAEFARRLRLSRPTIYREIADGSLPGVRLSERGAIRVPVAELDRLLESRR